MSLSLFSPAKLNLFLRILNKRSDGYHNLASLFQAIDFGDTIELAIDEKDTFSCTDPALACDASNLVIKALHLFRKKTGLNFPVKVHLKKRIPVQAGLGGGSSNAATMLWGLNMLSKQPAEICELQAWSQEIGSDIPFFFSCGTAFCQGRGEIVEDMPDLFSPKTVTLVKPKEGLSTPQIFKELKLSECSKEDPKKILDSFFSNYPIFINDLETPAFRLLPFLADLKKKLLVHTRHSALMTGSGTAFFCETTASSFDNTIFQVESRFINRQTGSWYKKMS